MINMENSDDIFIQQIQRALHRADCPESVMLLRYRWKQLKPTHMKLVESHLEMCATCTQQINQLLGPVTSPIHQSLLNIIKQKITVYTAQLLPIQGLAPSVRGESIPPQFYDIVNTSWQLVLTPSTEDRGYVLLGQLLGPDESAFQTGYIDLLFNNKSIHETSFDSNGWFEFRPLMAGQYVMWIVFPDSRTKISDITLGV